jgi:hypothetical protein
MIRVAFLDDLDDCVLGRAIDAGHELILTLGLDLELVYAIQLAVGQVTAAARGFDRSVQ